MNTSPLFLLRFAAAIIVIFFHESPRSACLQSAPKIFTSGPQMATFFFVLSGFMLLLSYYKDDDFSLRNYYTKRAARIIPVYLIALSLWTALDIYESHLDSTALLLNVFPKSGKDITEDTMGSGLDI